MGEGVNKFDSETFDLINHPHMADEIEDGKFELFVRNHWETDAGEPRTSNEIGAMMVPLLIKEVIFFNTPWTRTDLSKEDKKYLHKILVNCNDVFIWGCADAEEISMNEIPELYDMWLKDPSWDLLFGVLRSATTCHKSLFMIVFSAVGSGISMKWACDQILVGASNV